MRPETLHLLESLADAFAAERAQQMPEDLAAIDKLLAISVVSELRDAFLRGADAGYTAARAEMKKDTTT